MAILLRRQGFGNTVIDAYKVIFVFLVLETVLVEAKDRNC